ncbi:sigma-70 family RNA polymerase sigma factor [Streptomyces sp. NBC_00536]|uniref:sigma-70 family RNA polymerase sigma factor n=1 Tax=Streptomyces sp. NBC_00536 TaxID=2975769 RepID=UPI002E7FDBD0|nr:sigma-70 family RNA polymerase sigma factor [Streptomyces sp. NBC_00536]WUC80350.1 sigma-70 family RNA polymerase sigma factor [Streptomyces sp. NBC_00536]
MNENDRLAARFEEQRTHLRAVAYRMLGSLAEADDAVQEAWIRLDRSDTSEVTNLGGWLTTVVARVCLDQLRSRKVRREESLDGSPEGFLETRFHLPDPIVSRAEGLDPEQEVLLADSVGLALLVVLEQLAPAERLAFVLHDMFGVSFDEIAPIVDRTPAAARQLASRARRRVRGGAPVPDPDLGRQREVVGAFLAASRGGSFEDLIAVLDPEVVLRVDLGEVAGGLTGPLRGAGAVARQALTFQRLSSFARPALVNGAPGVVTMTEGKPVAVMGFTVSGGRIVAIDILADPVRLEHLDVAVLED